MACNMDIILIARGILRIKNLLSWDDVYSLIKHLHRKQRSYNEWLNDKDDKYYFDVATGINISDLKKLCENTPVKIKSAVKLIGECVLVLYEKENSSGSI